MSTTKAFKQNCQLQPTQLQPSVRVQSMLPMVSFRGLQSRWWGPSKCTKSRPVCISGRSLPALPSASNRSHIQQYTRLFPDGYHATSENDRGEQRTSYSWLPRAVVTADGMLPGRDRKGLCESRTRWSTIRRFLWNQMRASRTSVPVLYMGKRAFQTSVTITWKMSSRASITKKQP